MIKKLFFFLIFFLFINSISFSKEKEPIDEALDKIWGKEREIEVIQKRVFEKIGRHEFTLYTGTIPNDEFFMYFPLGLKYNYFFTETIGVEWQGAYLFKINSDLKAFLDKQEFFSSIELPQYLLFYTGISGLWAPIHGKISAFGSKLYHFDIALYFGAGMMGTKITKGQKVKNKYDVYGDVGTGFKFFLTDTLALRLDYRHYFYPAEGGGVSYPAEITLGFSVFTSAPK